MIINDYFENSKQVIRNQHWTTAKHKFRECFSLMRYLSDQGFTKEEIYKVCNSIDDYLDEDYLDQAWNMSTKVALAPYYSGITVKEYNYIDSLPVTKKYKEFLAQLCEFKRNNPNTFKNSQFAHFTCKWSEKQIQQGIEWNSKFKLYEIDFYKNTTYVTLKVSFLDMNDTNYITDYVFNELQCVCPSCGKQFTYDPLRRTDLCIDCYTQWRNRNRHHKCTTSSTENNNG